MGNSLSGSGF
uniref:Uncharacterized protein n=1 Tax=Anguilla anguilla TaxID=7936 RepID=A0A0E9PS98_ANGAN